MSKTIKFRKYFLRELHFEFEGTAWRGKNPRMDFGSWLEKHDQAAYVSFANQHLGYVVALGQSWYMWVLDDESDSGSTADAEEALLILWYGTRDKNKWIWE